MQTKPLQADKQPSFRAFWLLGSLCFLALWGLRLHSLHPAFHPDDSPEIAVAMADLGVAHPPGYPLPTLLGHWATRILPGAAGFSTNALAAFWGLLAWLLALVLAARSLDLRRPQDRLWLAVLALGLATLPQLWFQGQSAKGGLYTLNLALTLGAILAIQDGRRLALGWFLVGLGLANHYMSIVLFVPSLLAWSWRARPDAKLQARLALWTLPGLAVYLYLPLRALQHPGLNWGDPETWGRFVAVVLRRMYSGAESGQDLGNALHLGWHFLQLWRTQWHWAGLGLLALGWAPLWAQGPRWRPLLWGLLLYLAVVLAYNHPPQDAPWVINAFFLPVFVLGGILLMQGARRLQGWLSPGPSRALPWALGALLLALAPLRYRLNDYSHDYLLYDYAQDLCLLPARGATLLAAGGNDAFPVWYLQAQQQRRLDLTLVDVPLISDWYLEQLRSHIPQWQPGWTDRDSVVNGLLAGSQAPLYYSSHNPGDRGIPLGLVAWVPRAGSATNLTAQGLLDPWKAVRWRWVGDTRTPSDGNRRELLGYYADSAAALLAFAQAQHVTPLLAPVQRLEADLRTLAQRP